MRKVSEAEGGKFTCRASGSTGAAGNAKVKRRLIRCKVGGKLRFCSVEVEIVRLNRSIAKVYHTTSRLGIRELEALLSELRSLNQLCCWGQ